MWKMMDFFSGAVSGFTFAAKSVWGAELRSLAFCEIDPWRRKQLARLWPGVPIIEDINDEEQIAAHAQKIGCSRTIGSGDSKGRSQEQDRNDDSLCGLDLLTASPPCQPASAAGLRKGSSDERWLWPQTLKAVEIIKPRWILLENPAGITSLAKPSGQSHMESSTVRRTKTKDFYEAVFSRQEILLLGNIVKDIENLGYQLPCGLDGTPIIPVIPACAVGTWHRRNRVWIIAHSERCEGRAEIAQQGPERRIAPTGDNQGTCADTEHSGCERGQSKRGRATTALSRGQRLVEQPWSMHWLQAVEQFCRMVDGIPDRNDRSRAKRIAALGDSIVPQVAIKIMQAIKSADARGVRRAQNR